MRITSNFFSAFIIFVRIRDFSSLHIPKSTGSPPYFLTMLESMNLLLSNIEALPSFDPGSASSLPVESTATLTFLYTSILDIPTDAISPISAAVSHVPFLRRICPFLRSFPLGVILLPLSILCEMRILLPLLLLPSSTMTSSIIITESAPLGIFAPVAIATALPELILVCEILPAPISPITLSVAS